MLGLMMLMVRLQPPRRVKKKLSFTRSAFCFTSETVNVARTGNATLLKNGQDPPDSAAGGDVAVLGQLLRQGCFFGPLCLPGSGYL